MTLENESSSCRIVSERSLGESSRSRISANRCANISKSALGSRIRTWRCQLLAQIMVPTSCSRPAREIKTAASATLLSLRTFGTYCTTIYSTSLDAFMLDPLSPLVSNNCVFKIRPFVYGLVFYVGISLFGTTLKLKSGFPQVRCDLPHILPFEMRLGCGFSGHLRASLRQSVGC
jgi:hypothetical protein